jgi:putative FmdB family regulatory protein
MPLYEYKCENCGNQFEVIQKFSDPLVEKCPKCGGPVHKLMSSPAIQFKGSGWYITDYARKDSKSDSGAPAKSDGAGASTDSASKKSDKSEGGDAKTESTKSGKTESTASQTKSAADPVK